MTAQKSFRAGIHPCSGMIDIGASLKACLQRTRRILTVGAATGLFLSIVSMGWWSGLLNEQPSAVSCVR